MIRLVDDQHLGELLRDGTDAQDDTVFTTGCWYVRLCRAVLGATARPGALSGPFAALPPTTRERARRAVLELPESIGLVSPRDLAPLMGELHGRHALNLLGLEALAAAAHLEADVLLSVPSPRLEAALRHEGIDVAVG